MPTSRRATERLRRRAAAAPTARVALASLTALVAAGSAAFPDGAPWEAAASSEGCNQCHFDTAVTADSRALEIAGLPDRIDPGALYELTLTLSADPMVRAGFLLTATQDGAPAGSFEPRDERTSAQAAQVRSTEAGAALTAHGTATWEISWTAPSTMDQTVSFELWGNAANDDESPFGDATHVRVWHIGR